MSLIKKLRSYLPQFGLYFTCGLCALAADVGSFLFLFKVLGMWYIAASVVGGVIGFCTTFLCQKYVVFKKREDTAMQLVRLFCVDMCNIVITNTVLYGIVEFIGIGEEIGKIAAIGMVVFWNFFLYKFFVYR